ncbi:MAG: Na(+)-translocating NADH-quinone reductase subunit B [Nitrospirales bacterium]|nr:MAG: Na(+)-translocating NADH-quinone reductase subunit B [Nitrospirales bacterium]
MPWLRRLLDRWQPLFQKGGRYEKYFVVYEMIDGFLYTPSTVTRSAPHVRDGADLKRVMMYVFVAVTPCIAMAMYNIGYQANVAMAQLGLSSIDGWRGTILDSVGIGYDPANVFACVWHGFLYFFPVYVVTLVAGGLWEVLFAAVRNHEVNEGFLVTSILFVLTLPPDIPLWQVGIGISFGVVFGKEVFGGTGKNFLNPALTARAFLFFAFPAEMSGDTVWTAVDGVSGATALGIGAIGGLAAIHDAGLTWSQSFLGTVQGSMGETSTLACLLGAAFLIYTRVASWRIMAGVALGMIGTTILFNVFGSVSNPMVSLPWYWHFVIGGSAFGMVFMATDPVSASMTTVGRWMFGLLIGFMTILIRVANPAFPEGMMLAILFANIFSPLIDYMVIQVNVRKRVLRNT